MKRSAATQIFVALLVSALAHPQVGVAATPSLGLTQLSLSAAGPRVSVFVVPVDLSASQQQGVLEGATLAALEKAGRFTVVAPHDAFNPAAAQKRAEALVAAREKLKGGKQAIDELDNVKATADFTAALEALQGADLTREFPALLDAWTMKAAGHATGGENGPAKKDMEAVVSLAPRAEFSPTFFPPDLIKFAEAQRKQANNAKGELLVRTEPPGARVWVDGQYRGVSPVTIAGLTAAKHFVTASLGGYALAQSQVSPGEAQLDLELSELAVQWKKALVDIKRDPEAEARDTLTQELAKAGQVDQLVLLIAKKSTAGEQLELIGVRLEASDGHNAAYRVGTVNPGDADAMATWFDGLVEKDDARDGKRAVHHYRGAEGIDGRKVASYGLMGGGVALIAMGVVFGVMASGRQTAFVNTPQTQTGPSQLAAVEGRTFSVVADVSYVVGAAAAATGAVLFFTKPAEGAAPTTAGAADDTAAKDAEQKRLADEARAADAKKQEDASRADEADKKKKADDARAAEEQKKKDDEAAAAAAKKQEEPPPKKLSKKEQAALEKKEREEAERQRKEEAKRAAEEEKKRKEDEKRAADEEKKRKDEEKRAADEEKKKQDDEKKAASKPLTKKEKAEAERKAKEEEEARLKAEEEAKEKEAAEKKKREEEERKRREAEEKKRKEEDHDDLRNY